MRHYRANEKKKKSLLKLLKTNQYVYHYIINIVYKYDISTNQRILGLFRVHDNNMKYFTNNNTFLSKKKKKKR